MATRRRKPAAEKLPKQTLFKLRAGIGNDAAAQASYEKERRSKYRLLFNSVIGREVLADFLTATGVFAQDEAHSGDVANFRNGARWAGGEILRALGADDADVLTRVVLNDDAGEIFHED